MTGNFENWIPLNELRVGDLPKCGICPAVYALRDRRSQEVIKFGETDNLLRRIFGNFIGGCGGKKDVSTTQRVHIDLVYEGMIDRVDLAWVVTKDKAAARLMEGQFRSAYKVAHGGKRPLWDRNG
jgi:hypothetical protein